MWTDLIMINQNIKFFSALHSYTQACPLQTGRYIHVCVGEWDDGEFTVYINNPHCEVTPDGCPMFTDEHPQQQFIFGRYNSFKRAVNKAVTIVKARKYPKPIEIY